MRIKTGIGRGELTLQRIHTVHIITVKRRHQNCIGQFGEATKLFILFPQVRLASPAAVTGPSQCSWAKFGDVVVSGVVLVGTVNILADIPARDRQQPAVPGRNTEKVGAKNRGLQRAIPQRDQFTARGEAEALCTRRIPSYPIPSHPEVPPLHPGYQGQS
ncbi:unnamed protein product [Nesidiocoris tenuis]|uniref:Uncharacterized protein n=1 Tax=Nesidiocoris tenuis TaxID=355587 RepID=A0A6H5G9J8_9HEMI|nr:unnamed protein product [Nesidiocoris tenuis]